jgi:hypothetical protein
MVFSVSYQYLYRSGPQDRTHAQRYAYVKGVGWFLYLRGDLEIYDGIEVDTGIAGPFNSQADARTYLFRLIDQIQPEYNKRISRRLVNRFF